MESTLLLDTAIHNLLVTIGWQIALVFCVPFVLGLLYLGFTLLDS